MLNFKPIEFDWFNYGECATITSKPINMSSLIKFLSLVVYNSLNNAHHSTCRVGGLFHWDNLK